MKFEAVAMLDVLSELFRTFIWDWNLRFFPLYFAVFVVLAFVIYRFRDDGSSGFLAWLFPRKIYLNSSQLVDLKLFVIGKALHVLGVFGAVAGTTAIAVATISAISSVTGTIPAEPGLGTSQGIVATLLIIIAADFSVYWIHRMHHDIDFLWPFHSVHHSAEVMSPITVYRKHPVYDLISSAMKALLIGVAQGLILAFTFDGTSVITIGGANAAYFLFNIVGSNFRHTHIWVSYGNVLSHVFISPAQHQIHHSRAAEHLNKNHGEVFALWDWMFKTLYVPKYHETLDFGIVDASGNLVPQPHGTLKDALTEPFVSCRSVLKARFGTAKKAQSSENEHTA